MNAREIKAVTAFAGWVEELRMEYERDSSVPLEDHRIIAIRSARKFTMDLVKTELDRLIRDLDIGE